MGGANSAYGGGDRRVHDFGGVTWEEERPLRRTRRRWEDNIQMDLQEVGCGRTDWIELAQYKGR
jgi:hypothetical protein